MSRFGAAALWTAGWVCAITIGFGGLAHAGPQTLCGDGTVEGTELCDDGNTAPGDGCSATCIPELCGDGVLEPDTEECDDGNTVALDGCSPACACEAGQCGDGVVNAQCGEVCDDGNTAAGDGCDASCQLESTCGDGLIEVPEVCDDGNTASGDGCRGDCLEIESIAQTSAQQRCINELNQRGAGVWRAAAREARACVSNLARGRDTGSLAACLRTDPRGRIGRAEARTVQGEARRCTVPRPTFGATEAALVNQAARDQHIGDFEDVFGVDGVSNIVLSSADRAAARCQGEVARALQRTQDRATAETNRAKRDAIGGRRGAPQAENGADLAAALEAAFAGDRLEREAARAAARIARRCDGADLAALFPGDAVVTNGVQSVADSVDARARCRVCLYLNAADGLSLDCDVVDNGGADESCS